jgi:perosamine synthetase
MKKVSVMPMKSGLIQISSTRIGPRAALSVLRVLLSGNLSQGAKVLAFESEFSKTVNGRECVAVNSGTSALHLSLLALGIKEGDEVIVPAFTFAATANVVALCGAKPIFADIELESYNISTDHLKSLITSRTKAIIPVHLYGRAANMKSITEIATSFGIYVVEDSAQAHLATSEGGPVGTQGDVACFSFYATKNLSTGEGGMVVTANKEVAYKVRLLRNQGMIERYKNEIPGFNNRMTEIQATIGLSHLRRLEKRTRRRILNACAYNRYITAKQVIKPIKGNGRHVFHQYTISVPEESRSALKEHLLSNGVRAEVYYPSSLPELTTFRGDKILPNSKTASRTVLSLPVHPKVRLAQIKRISKLIDNFYSK